MTGWISRFFQRAPAPPEALKGIPAKARVKRYTAMSGYVYEYAYLGYRDAAEARQHYFNVSADRKSWFELQVAVEDDGIRAWERDKHRELNAAERYAVAKLALFEAFDERAEPAAMREPVRVPAARIAALLELFDL